MGGFGPTLRPGCRPHEPEGISPRAGRPDAPGFDVAMLRRSRHNEEVLEEVPRGEDGALAVRPARGGRRARRERTGRGRTTAAATVAAAARAPARTLSRSCPERPQELAP